MIPSRFVIRSFALRGALFWLGIRAAVALFLAVQELPPFPRSGATPLFFAALTVAACFADVHVRRERALIGNLGVSLWTLAVIFVAPALLAEALLARLPLP